jgi:PAS domain S-box-containing protein
VKAYDPGELRRRAEATLSLTPRDACAPDPMDNLVHELRIHQIELEAQNEALRQVQLELEASRSRYRELYELAPIGYVSLSDEGRLREVNLVAASLLGARREELIGRSLSTFLDHDSIEEFARHRAAVAAAPGQGQCELSFTGPAGARHVRIESVRVRPGDWRAALIDVTEQRRLEHQLSEARKLEAIGTLASGVAHEFNNRLMAIVGCADMALRQLGEGDGARAPIEQLRQAALRGRSVSTQLLTFARRDDLDEASELDAAVGAASAMLRQSLGDGIALDLQLAAPVHVPISGGVIEQILLTLAANARDAMNGHGTLRVETRLHGDAHAVLVVSDDGAGMEERVRARAFDPFFTTKTAGAGFGLGLSLVYGIVTRARGTIELRSRVGVGTTVWIDLPCVEAEATAAPAMAVPKEASRARAGREQETTVLVVEDEPLIRMTLCRYLEAWGYRVLEAATAAAALAHVHADPDDVGVLISDVVLDFETLGSHVASSALALNPDLAVIYISAHPQEFLYERGWVRPDDVVIEKPFEPEQLRRALRASLQPARVSAGD